MQQTQKIEVPKELMDLYELSAADLKILAEEFHPEMASDIHQVKRDVGLLLTHEAGLPCGEDHQQPYDFVRMFPISLSPDMYEANEEFDDVVFLFFLWTYKCQEILQVEAFDQAIHQIKRMCVWLAYLYGDLNKTRRRIELSESLFWIKWFRFTEGCFDLDSGALIDPETAALREFVATWGNV